MPTEKRNDTRTFLIVGGGPAGVECAKTLREEGFMGNIEMVCRQNYLPYNRAKLNKSFSSTIEDFYIEKEEFYVKNEINVYLGINVTSVNPHASLAKLSNGFEIKYDKIFIATGSSAKKLSVEGYEKKNIVELREYDDLKKYKTC